MPYEHLSEETTIDKSGWLAGQDEPDRVEWRYQGLPLLLLRGPLGQWCGYVGLPESHPWHGTHFSHLVEHTRVHGDLSYSDSCSEPICHVPREGESDDVWWIGFAAMTMRDFLPRMEFQMRGKGLECSLVPPLVTYFTQAEAMAETESLADQVIAHAEP